MKKNIIGATSLAVIGCSVGLNVLNPLQEVENKRFSRAQCPARPTMQMEEERPTARPEPPPGSCHCCWHQPATRQEAPCLDGVAGVAVLVEHTENGTPVSVHIHA